MYSNKRLHIFDLDYTLILWKCNHCPCVCDQEYEKKAKEMLKKLKTSGKILALASHNKCAKYHLTKMGVYDLFDVVIGEYPRDKSDMIKEILEKTGCTIEEAVFYDDNMFNIKRAESLGVDSYYVKDKGIEFELVI